MRSGQDPTATARLPKGLVRRVWREFGGDYGPRLLLLFAVIAAASTLTVLPAVLIAPIVNTITGDDPGGFARLNLLTLALLAVGLGSVLFGLWQRYLSSRIGEDLILDLRQRVYTHVLRLPIAFFTRTQTGALISRLNSDVIGAQRALTGTVGTMTANVVQSIVALAAMARISVTLTGLALLVLPLFVVLAKQAGKVLQRLTRQSMELNAEMNSVMTERLNVSGALLVKLFGRLSSEGDEFAGSARKVADVGVRSAVVGRLFFATLGFVATAGSALAYWYGGRQALGGALDPGDVVSFAALVGAAYAPLAALTNAPVEVVTALVSFDRVFEILDVEPPIRDAASPTRIAPVRGRITFDDVHFAYPSAADSSVASLERGIAGALDATPGELVLQGVSFTAEPGQMIALVGPSGAGKTTITSLVPRLYDVTSGAVRIDDVDVREVPLDELRGAIGVVSQDPHLFHETIRDNLRYARPDATDDELVAACAAAQIHDFIASLPGGYDTVVGERGYRLSGGEKQRLSIARVLLKDPAIVVLDEATAHLDSENEAAVQAALSEALRGRTSLVIAHRLSTIVAADQIIVVDDGRVVQRGTHAELVNAEGLYAVLARTQLVTS